MRKIDLERHAPPRHKKARTKRAVKETPYQKSETLLFVLHCTFFPKGSVGKPHHLAAQMVPAGLVMGTPTALPYSVHEPS
jgi:hypothetical protein